MMGKTVPKELYDELFKKYTELVDDVMKLRREGYVKAAPEPTFEPPEEDELYPVPEEVLEAIHSVSEPNSLHAKRTQEVAFSLMREGVKVEDVITKVINGEEVL